MSANSTKRKEVANFNSYQIGFVRDIGKFGDGPAVEEVLAGTYDSPRKQRRRLKIFWQAVNNHEIWWNVRQNQSLRDIGIWWKHGNSGKNIQHQPRINILDTIRRLWATLPWVDFFQHAEIPEISGYSPSRHRCYIDLMILKKALPFGLLESIFNHSNKMF